MKTSEDDPSPSANGNIAEAGYRRPPKEHQFKKGQSGNPTGRPRKEHSEEDVSDMGREELLRPIAVLEDGKKKKNALDPGRISTPSDGDCEGRAPYAQVHVRYAFCQI